MQCQRVPEWTKLPPFRRHWFQQTDQRHPELTECRHTIRDKLQIPYNDLFPVFECDSPQMTPDRVPDGPTVNGNIRWNSPPPISNSPQFDTHSVPPRPYWTTDNGRNERGDHPFGAGRDSLYVLSINRKEWVISMITKWLCTLKLIQSQSA